MKKKLFIFSNESISSQDGKFYCDNIDLKSTPEGLNKKFEVNLFARKSRKKRSHEIKVKNVNTFNNIFSYISCGINASKKRDAKFLIISISPYTFIISLVMMFDSLTKVVISLLALGIVVSLLGGNVPFVGEIAGNITGLVQSLGDAGIVGLIAAIIILNLFK